KKTYNTASATLMYAVMIQDRVGIIMISSGSNTSLKSSSTSSESNSSEDIVYRKGPSKSLQQWYYNDTKSSKGPSKALL
nr:hypothetical protein [Tanacetum cinerariifolium]